MDRDRAKIVKRSTLDLGGLNPREQFALFSEEICRWFANSDGENLSDRTDFPASLSAIDLGVSWCTLSSSPALRFTRTADTVRKDGRDDLILNYIIAGNAQLDHSGHVQNAGPGELVVLDHGQTGCYVARSTKGSRRSLSIPLKRRAFRDDDAIRALLEDQRLIHHRLAPLLKLTLGQLAAGMSAGSADEIVTLVDMAESLALLIAHDDTFESLNPDTAPAFDLIEMEIRKNLHDCDLSLRHIAHRFDMSVRQVQRIMARHGTGFSDLVRQKRLAKAMNRLGDGAYAATTIEEIAYGCGFSDLTTFYRAFKTTFQCRPGDVRRQSRQLP